LSTIPPEQQHAILVIGLYAAFADGRKDDREREELRRIAESLATRSGAPDLARLYQDVLLKRMTLEAAAAALREPAERQLAYELAVCVCDADGRQQDAERRFLAGLKTLLQLDPAQTAEFEREADAVLDLCEVAAPAAGSAAAPGAAPAAVSPAKSPSAAAATTAGSAAASAAAATPPPQPSPAELDKTILNYALLNGALELLPQSWASMAIIPLQIRMVYGIGKSHGVELDQGHIREFIAAAGVGLTSQYLEQFGRKLLGGLLGKAGGKSFGRLGGAATGMAFSFATTYALGQLARRYYAGGRVMTTPMLRETFSQLLEPARQMQAQYLPQIRQQAGTLDLGRVMAMVRGTP